MSRCEVVSNLKNGLKGREPLRTALVFALPQRQRAAILNSLISKSQSATLPATLLRISN